MSTVFGITALQFFEIVFLGWMFIAAAWAVVKIIVPRFYVSMMRTQTNLQSQVLSTAQQSLQQLQGPPSPQEKPPA